MLNYIWAAMILVGISYGAACGKAPEVTEGALAGAKDAVNLCLTMAGVMALWTGLMEIAEKSGLMGKMASALRPVIRFLFPRIPEGHPALENISANMIANLLGLGWAATPAGLQAMEELAKLEEERREQGIQRYPDNKGMRSERRQQYRKAMPHGVASNEMCTFLIINISSLQLIPVNIIAYRSQYGSVNPAAVTGPAILATAVSTGVAVVFCKVMERRRRA